MTRRWLLLAPAFVSACRAVTDQQLVEQDKALLAEFEQAKAASLPADQYREKLESLRRRELALFETVRGHKFDDITASNYFLRGRMKFPSSIQMALEHLQTGP